MRSCTSNPDILISGNWKPCLRPLCLLLSLGPMLDVKHYVSNHIPRSPFRQCRRTILLRVHDARISRRDHVARFEGEFEEKVVDLLEVGGCHGRGGDVEVKGNLG